jgi:RNA polymerase sigma factor (sigma-70 family)
MANGLTTTWRRIRSILGAASARDADAVLLARFVAGRDEAAFAELARRHGPLVYGVCRRVLADPHDAEDAFQATFLILSSRASAIRNGDSLSCWLHGVALRVAVRLRHKQRRRIDRAPLPEDVPQPETDDVTWREVRRLLDEELAGLPERFRQPLILCYLEGKTRDEAAAALGWTLATFRGRLERARERLRRRLERRGVALSAALLATLAARQVDAAIPNLTAASSNATALATEVMRTMLLGKVKAAGGWCLAVLFLGVGVGVGAYHAVPAAAGPRPEVKAPAPPPKPPTPPEADGIVKDFKAHRDTFSLHLTLKLDEKTEGQDKDGKRFPLRKLHLYTRPLTFDPPTFEEYALITNEQAAKVVALLAKDNFFRESVAEASRLPERKGSRGELCLRYHKEKAAEPVERWGVLEWDAPLVRQLEALRKCLDGDAAKLFDKMVKSLEDARKQVEKTVDGPIRNWRAAGSTPAPKVFEPPVGTLAFSPDGTQLLAYETKRNTIRLLAADSLKELPIQYPIGAGCRPLGFNDDGLLLALCPQRKEKSPDDIDPGFTPQDRKPFKYHLLELRSGKELGPFETPWPVRDVALGSGLTFVFTDSANLSRVSVGKPGNELEHRGTVSCLAVSPDGKTLATGTLASEKEPGKVTLWNVEKRKATAWQELPGGCAALQFTRDGSRLLAASKHSHTGEGEVLWLDAKTADLLGGVVGPAPKERAAVVAMAPSPDGKLLAVLWGAGATIGDGTRLRLYDADSGKEVAAPDCGKQVSAVAFSPKGGTLATGDDSGGVTVWEPVR